MIFGKSDNKKRIEAARADLITAEAKTVQIAAGEAAASLTSEAYAAWQSERDRNTSEIQRLIKLTAAIEAGGEAQRQAEELAALRKRVAAARKLNEAVAQRLIAEGPKLSAAIQALVRDAAAAAIEADAVNLLLPDGEQYVQTADFLARGRAALPREEISRRESILWVFEQTGELVGDQDAVIPMGKDVGTLQGGIHAPAVRCVKRKFELVEFHPAEAAEHPAPVFASIRIPSFTSGVVDFDGQLLGIHDVAEMSPKSTATKRRERPVYLEPMPVGPMPDVRSDLAKSMQRLSEATI